MNRPGWRASKPGEAGSAPAARATVLLDTNAIMLPFTARTDLEGEIERLVGPHDVVVPACVAFELEQISRRKDAAGRAAKAARKYADRFRLEPTKYTGDDGILEVARRTGAIVVTNDRRLQSEAVSSGLRVIVAREVGRLAWRGDASGSSS